MITFQTEDIEMPAINEEQVREWIKAVAASYGKRVGPISYFFCSDQRILEVNLEYLQHDYYTDIITFDYCEGNRLSGDLFISVDSVRENALFYGTEFSDELNRVMVHGLLHLIGYDDHTEEEQKTMREKEDYYLSVRKSLDA